MKNSESCEEKKSILVRAIYGVLGTFSLPLRRKHHRRQTWEKGEGNQHCFEGDRPISTILWNWSITLIEDITHFLRLLTETPDIMD